MFGSTMTPNASVRTREAVPVALLAAGELDIPVRRGPTCLSLEVTISL